MDKMIEAFDKFSEEHPAPTEVELFQAGWSASAVSMRERAIAAVRATFNPKDAVGSENDAINKIGALPDIPTE